MGLKAVNEEQKAIIEYIKEHFVGWLEEKNIIPFPQPSGSFDKELLERMVRVEEEIKRQNEKFDHMKDKFDYLNDKFDFMMAQTEKRFNRQFLFQLATFSAIVGSAVAILLQG